MRYPWGLRFWNSGEWQVCNERLHDMEKRHVKYNPIRNRLFRSLTSVGSPSDVRVCMVGQDPYPTHSFATGLAFSIPPEFGRNNFPPTLRELFAEYERDLGFPIPDHGDLGVWASQGVLLWNAIPVTRDGVSLGCDWDEWQYLNQEVFHRLSEKGIVFAFLGGVARRYVRCVSPNNRIIETSHPSPRGSMNSRSPFKGSRLFSTINDHLNELGLEPIDWRLDGVSSKKNLQEPDMVGGLLLPNTTGADLGGHPRRPKPNLYVPGTKKDQVDVPW